MADFNTLTEWLAVHDQDLETDSREVLIEEVLQLPSFQPPLQLLAFWQDMPGDVPHFKNLKPAVVDKKLLPYLFILDVVRDESDCEPDFRWRLFGTMNRQKYGLEATGHLLSTAMDLDASIPVSMRLAREATKSGEPRYMYSHFLKDHKIIHRASTVILPLSGDDGSVERLFGCTHWA